jgi:phosphatidylinositol-3,4,5-trisphosphate 3-phosphatase/dual-specificity protein phosphatase PTEN
MGFPSTGLEGIYRNRASSLVAFLDAKHGEHYKVYNLCSELDRQYDPSLFHGRVSYYPFDDHNAPPFHMLLDVCEDAAAFLALHPENVVAMHCKAGKGRTGVMVCAYLIFSGFCDRADDAMRFYGVQRTFNGKGVTIPSQHRYIRYFERYLLSPVLSRHASRLTGFRLAGLPKDAYKVKATVSVNNLRVFRSEHAKTLDRSAVIPLGTAPVLLCGDVKVEVRFFTGARGSSEKLCAFWFNTNFVDGQTLLVPKAGLDGKAHKDKADKVWERDAHVLLSFEPLTPIADAAFESQRASKAALDSPRVVAAAAAARRSASKASGALPASDRDRAVPAAEEVLPMPPTPPPLGEDDLEP